MCIQSHNTVVLMIKLQKSCGEYIYKTKREHSIPMSNIKKHFQKSNLKKYIKKTWGSSSVNIMYTGSEQIRFECEQQK